ncbi:MAG: hypothetical protein ACM3ML_36360 [Micromonosporaceae bacterium]
MTRIAVDPGRTIGRLDRNVFGGFVEHLGNLYPLIVMGGLVTIIPLSALFLVLQRYWRGGLLLGSLAN